MYNLTIVADDLTGTADSGAFPVSCGRKVQVIVNYESDIQPHENGEVLGINMSSRTIPGKDALKMHTVIAKKIKDFPDQLIMKKMDTGFRGNASFEIEGMLKGLDTDICFIIDNIPDLGTFTLYGHQYAEGQILHKSLYAKDPIKAPTKSFIPEIMQEDTSLKVGLVNIDSVKGTDLLASVKKTLSEGAKIIVFDAITKADGLKIVSTLQPAFPKALWAGSLGMVEALSGYLFGDIKPPVLKERDIRCACFTASAYEATKNQIKLSQKKGLEVIDLDIERVLSNDRSAVDEAIEACITANRDSDFILRPYCPPELSAEGLDKLILKALSECTEKICSSIIFDRLVIIGGETSQALFNSLKINRLMLNQKPETGIASGTIIDSEYKGKEIALKGGSVGTVEALNKMLCK